MIDSAQTAENARPPFEFLVFSLAMLAVLAIGLAPDRVGLF